MRSMFMLAALVAVIGFTGCCGTGGSCKLAGLRSGKTVASSALAGNSASIGDCGCSSGGCSSGGCSGGGAGACGPDSVVTISAPYACEGGCGEVAPMSEPSSCGCSSCGDAAVENAPVQSSGCRACDAASSDEPRGLFSGRKKRAGLTSNKGMGLSRTAKGLACQPKRALQPAAASTIVSDLGMDVGGGCEACDAGVSQTAAQMPGGFLFGGSSEGRRISTGVASDTKECNSGGCGVGGRGHRGCGCGAGGKLSKLANAAGATHPYGGAIPHTNPAMGQQPQSGIAPQYAYPYYTTRGPRDFLRDNPPSIGY